MTPTPADRDRLVEMVAARLASAPGGWVGHTPRWVAQQALDALAQVAQDAPLVIRPDGSVGRLEQVGWMPSAALMQEHGVRPTDDEYLTSLESAEYDGGIREQFADRMLPIYRIREEAPDA